MADRIAWREEASPAVNARRELPELVRKYFAFVRESLSKKTSPTKLHSLRLATKRLRYTLELFRSCYGPGLDLRMSKLRELQSLLGDMNDSAATKRLIAKKMKNAEQRERADAFLKERTQHKAKQFRKAWAEQFDAPGRERWWTGYLEREARPQRSAG